MTEELIGEGFYIPNDGKAFPFAQLLASVERKNHQHENRQVKRRETDYRNRRETSLPLDRKLFSHVSPPMIRHCGHR